MANTNPTKAEQIKAIINALRSKREAKQGEQANPSSEAVDTASLEDGLADELALKNHTIVYENGDIDYVDGLATAVVQQLELIKGTYELAALVDYLADNELLNEHEQRTAGQLLGHIGRGQHLALRILLAKVDLKNAED
jgi:hypothetical protein